MDYLVRRPDSPGASTGRDYLSPKQRRQRNREEMVTAILETARDIMRQDGVTALNLNEIARRLGMTTPAIYVYFPSKDALYDALPHGHSPVPRRG